MIIGLYKVNGVNIFWGVVDGVLKVIMILSLGKLLVGNFLKFIFGVGIFVGGILNVGVLVVFIEVLGFVVVSELRGVDNVDIIDLVNVIKDVFKGFIKK